MREAQQAFAEQFGHEPEGVWAAPGRVNLIGEHTDYNEGWVLPFAIDRWVTVAASRREDGTLRLHSRQLGKAELQLADIAPGAVAGWAAYIAGGLWVLAREGVVVRGLDLLLTSDVPVGSGLSSSAAVECATVLAVRDLYGGPHDLSVLARLAQRAENEVVGVPSGVMDQMASMVCTSGHALLLDCRSLETEQVPFTPEDEGLTVLVIDTRVPRNLAAGSYAERRSECEQVASMLGIASLRDLTELGLQAGRRLLDDRLYHRARHVMRENARVGEAAALLRAGRLADVGPLLTASHDSLRDDFEVTSPELDTAVTAALGAGALGARMTGAGFGGCVLALVPAGAADTVASAVRDAFADNGFAAPRTFAVTPAPGARRLA